MTIQNKAAFDEYARLIAGGSTPNSAAMQVIRIGLILGQTDQAAKKWLERRYKKLTAQRRREAGRRLTRAEFEAEISRFTEPRAELKAIVASKPEKQTLLDAALDAVAPRRHELKALSKRIGPDLRGLPPGIMPKK